MHAIVLQILLTLARLIRKDQEMQETRLPYLEALRELLTGMVENNVDLAEEACLVLLRLMPLEDITATERLMARTLLNQIGGSHGNLLD